MFAIVLASVVPPLVTALIGYFWARAGNRLDSKGLTPLLTDVAAPCLAFSAAVQMDTPLAEIGATAAASLAVLLITLAAMAALVKLLRLDMRTYLPPLSFPNVGNLGLSVSMSAFGNAGLSFAMIFMAIIGAANNTVGRAISVGDKNWGRALLTPFFPALLLGIVLQAYHIRPPAWIMTTTAMIGALAIPMMLVMLGVSLASIRLQSIRLALGLSVVRIALGAAIAFGVAALFGFQGAQRGALIIQSAMPAAVMNYLFAQLADANPDEVASLVVISTLLSIVTTPALVAALLAFP
ncbi:MAG: AEC family transporter [Hyphomonadaceae bacterium]